jgi:hypothetical protein
LQEKGLQEKGGGERFFAPTLWRWDKTLFTHRRLPFDFLPKNVKERENL